MTEILFNIADLAPGISMNKELENMIVYLRELSAKKPEETNDGV